VSDDVTAKRRLIYAIIGFGVAWVPPSIILGVRHGRSLRFTGDDTSHWGPIAEGIINYAFFAAAPAFFAGVMVFVFHAAWTERRDSRQ
jgi:hypothetical protein